MPLGLTAADRDRITKDAVNKQTEVLGAKMGRLVQRLALSRPDRKEDIASFVAKLGDNAVYESYTLQRAFTMVTATAYVSFTANKIYPWVKGNGATSPAPAGEVAIFDRITLVAQHDIKVATLAELLEELDVIIHWGSKARRDTRVPFSSMCQSWIEEANAGNNAGTLVAGNRPRHLRTGRAYELDLDQPLVVMPQDTHPSLEFAWNEDYNANTAPAGSDASLVLNAIFEGERLAA